MNKLIINNVSKEMILKLFRIKKSAKINIVKARNNDAGVSTKTK
ncbi:MAG: hypothetical protein WBG69_02980 [Arcobacteraceae bacterium]